MLTMIQRNKLCIWYFLSSKWSYVWLKNINWPLWDWSPYGSYGRLAIYLRGFFSWIKDIWRTQISQCQCYTWLYYKTFRQIGLKLKNMHSSTSGEAERVSSHLLISQFLYMLHSSSLTLLLPSYYFIQSSHGFGEVERVTDMF